MATKTFDVICIEDYGVVVDREAKIVGGDKLYFKTGNKVIIADKGWNNSIDLSCYKIIASIYRRIEDIPLIDTTSYLELSKLCYQVFGYTCSESISMTHYDVKIKDAFIAGYKAASKERMYSEEDVFNFIHYLVNDDPFSPYEYVDERPEELKSLIKSWRKLPKQVELEMEYRNGWGKLLVEEQAHPQELHLKVKVTNPETNTINPVKLIYE